MLGNKAQESPGSIKLSAPYIIENSWAVTQFNAESFHAIHFVFSFCTHDYRVSIGITAMWFLSISASFCWISANARLFSRILLINRYSRTLQIALLCIVLLKECLINMTSNSYFNPHVIAAMFLL